MFQLTAARRRLPNLAVFPYFDSWFQLTAARRRLLNGIDVEGWKTLVSTHSRPKAAADKCGRHGGRCSSFNSQPPEGGCFERDWSSRHLL